MAPKPARGADSGLNFIHNHKDAVALGNVTNSLKETCRCLVITTFSLDRFNNNGSDRRMPRLDETLKFLKTVAPLLDCFRKRELAEDI